MVQAHETHGGPVHARNAAEALSPCPRLILSCWCAVKPAGRDATPLDRSGQPGPVKLCCRNGISDEKRAGLCKRQGSVRKSVALTAP